MNSCDSARRGPQMITSASDDCTIKVWDPRKRGGDAVTTFNNNFQVMSVCFNDTADQVITGGLDNEIKVLYLYFIVYITYCLIFLVIFIRFGIYVKMLYFTAYRVIQIQ